MAVSVAHILEAFPENLQWAAGPKDREPKWPCSPHQLAAGGLCFCPDAESLSMAAKGGVAVVVTSGDAWKEVQTVPNDVTVLIARHLQLAMAQVNGRFFDPRSKNAPLHEIHRTAVVSPSAKVDPTATIAAYAVIGDNVIVEKNAFIGAHTVIENDSKVGAGTILHPHVFIGWGVELGQNCEIKPHSSIGTDGYGYAQDERGRHFKKPHYGRVLIGDRVSIGSGVYVDRGTFEDAVIGEGTKIDNYCHFGHNVKIGKHCLITAGMITAGSVTIGDHCVFGGRTTVAGHLNVASMTQVAGLSGISKTVSEGGQYGGYPLMPLKQHLKVHATLVHLVEMRRQIHSLLKKFGIAGKKEDGVSP